MHADHPDPDAVPLTPPETSAVLVAAQTCIKEYEEIAHER